MQHRSVCLIPFLLIALGGCNALLPQQSDFDRQLVLPKPSMATTASNISPSADKAANSQRSATTMQEPSSCEYLDSNSTSYNKDQRNACVYDLMSLIDDAYYRYRAGITSNVGATNATFDILSTAASTASAATVGSAAKVLSGISAVSTQGKTAIGADLLYNNTIQALLNEMNASRSKQRSGIILSLQSPISAYGIHQAYNDLIAYLYAGTLSDALGQLTQDAAANAQKCTAVSSAISAAAASGAKPARTPAATAATSNTTSTSDQCKAIADTLTIKFDTDAKAQSLRDFLAPGGVFDKDAYKAASICAKSQANSFDLTKYTISPGNYDVDEIANDPTVDETYKTKIVTCAKAALAAPAG